MPIAWVWGGINCEGWRLIVLTVWELDLTLTLSEQLILFLLIALSCKDRTVKVIHYFVEHLLKEWMALA